MLSQPIIILCAWVLDAIFGDPESMPHPVRLIGRFIQALETWTRRWMKNRKMAGVLTGLIVPGVVFFCTMLLVKASANISTVAGYLVSVVIIYTCISTRCLGDEAVAILKKLRDGDITGSRKRLSRVVGRDIEYLNQKEIIRATVETVSENTVDGIIAPLFYAFLGGAPLAMAYKAINTLDSMVGYKNERYREFGWFSARLDDAANFIPARLCLILISLASLFLYPKRTVKVFKTGLRDGRNSPSPNAGFPEACFAAALGIQLGGECSYDGVISRKPLIGDKERENDTEDISRAVRLMWFSSAFALAVFSAAGILLGF
jgi:adenosylcobinamide-phosphate synthase